MTNEVNTAKAQEQDGDRGPAHWKGRPLTELNRDELFEVVAHLNEVIASQQRWRATLLTELARPPRPRGVPQALWLFIGLIGTATIAGMLGTVPGWGWLMPVSALCGILGCVAAGYVVAMR